MTTLAKTYRGTDDASARTEEYGHRYFASETLARAALLPGESLATRTSPEDGWSYRGYQEAGGFRPIGAGRDGHGAVRTSLTDFAEFHETHRAAAERALSQGLTLGKYADPTEDAREGLTADEAADVAREDVSLVYVVLS